MSDISEWTKQPQQARSQRTLDALLDATEALLENRLFQDISINEIIARADSSAGSFYSRFNDKQALLHALHERFIQRSLEKIEMLQFAASEFKKLEQDQPDLDHGRVLAQWVVEALVRNLQRNRGLLRAVAIESFRNPRFVERAFEVMASTREWVANLLRPYRNKQSVEEFDANVEIALRMVIATLDQLLFIPPSANMLLVSEDNALVETLTRAFVRQLRME